MTNEQFISLETARLAKKAGFDWSVRAHYCEKETKALLHDPYPTDKWNTDYYEGCLSAPTQAVLQRWLREEKQLNIGMGIDREGMWACFIHSSLAYYRESLKKVIFKHTYEAALEAGLQKCLTLIIEKQQ